jgi:hypothetical protein
MTMFGSQWLANAGADYEISQSIRFNDDDSSKLTGSTGQTGDGTQWTIAMWVKRGVIDGNTKTIWSAGDGSSKRAFSRFVSGGSGSASEDINFAVRTGGSWYELNVDVSFRDPSAWYHFVWVWDSDNGTAADRMRIYVNGDRLTSFSNTPSYPASATATDSWNNSSYAHQIGFENNTRFFDGYLAEMYHIDGQALTPASFGETNDDGVWVPKDASSLTFGTRGFYLKGQDSSALGDDSSGNGNDFTSSGLAAADQMSDSPTNNSSIFSPIASCNVSGQALTISDGNLRTSAGGTSNAIEAVTQIAPTAGKYYAEFTLNAAPQLSNQYPAIGIIGIDLNITGGNNLGGSTFFGYLPSGVKKNDNSDTSYGDTFGSGDVIGIALDLDNQKIYFSKNGTYQNSGDPAAGSNAAFTNLVAGTEYRFCISHAGSTATDVTGNFGASAFATAAPTGFKALNTSNLPATTIKDGSAYFHTQLYTGNGSSGLAITNDANAGDFKPDLFWVSPRSRSDNRVIIDSVRGQTKRLKTNATAAEDTDSPAQITFETDGFDLDTTDANFNGSSETYVAWQWKTQGGAGSSNEDGSINTVSTSVNTTAGHSIIRWTGTAANGTIGHGLGVQPKFWFLKNAATTNSWLVGTTLIPNTSYLSFNSDAEATSDAFIWNSTYPTSSVINLGSNVGANGSSGTGNMICYAFAEVAGYSSFGKYVGNGSSTDGPFIYTGFRPAYIATKNITNSGDQWPVADSKRSPFNVCNATLLFSLAHAETTGYQVDLLSNGFKARTTDHAVNESGATYVYWAFAENPFGGDGAAPVTAR